MIKLVLLAISVLLLSSCTSLQLNGSELRKACKSGVTKYDDGSLSFECAKEERVQK